MSRWELRVEESGRQPVTIQGKVGLRIGRHPDNDIVITDPKASGFHAELRVDSTGAVVIVDLGSTNKTRVETGPILGENETFPVADGVKIFVGRTVIRFIDRQPPLEDSDDSEVHDPEFAAAETVYAAPVDADDQAGSDEDGENAEDAGDAETSAKAAAAAAEKKASEERQAAAKKRLKEELSAAEKVAAVASKNAAEEKAAADKAAAEQKAAEEKAAADQATAEQKAAAEKAAEEKAAADQKAAEQKAAEEKAAADKAAAERKAAEEKAAAEQKAAEEKAAADKAAAERKATEEQAAAEKAAAEQKAAEEKAAADKAAAERKATAEKAAAEQRAAAEKAAADKAAAERKATAEKAAAEQRAAAEKAAADKAVAEQKAAAKKAEDQARAAATEKPAPKTAPAKGPAQEEILSPGDEEESEASTIFAGNVGEVLEKHGEKGLAELAEFKVARPRLLIASEAILEMVFIATPVFLVGRSEKKEKGVHCRLTHDAVSSVHARILFQKRRFYIEDQGSRNGTFLGHELLPPEQPRELASNTHVRFGTVDALWVTDTDATGTPISPQKYEDALEILKGDGAISALVAKTARGDAKEKAIHPGESLLLMGRITVAQWCDAMARAPFLNVIREKQGAQSGSRGLLVLMVVIGLAAAAWYFRRQLGIDL